MTIVLGIVLALAGGWMLAQNAATKVGGPLVVAGLVLLLVKALL
ncbi:hypothetical protein [Bradyrhizobium sp.]|nr:hypothetical protein [Bradyrhizobium sp.]